MNESCNLFILFTELKTIPMIIVVTVHSGMECKGNLEKKNPSQPCEYSHKIQDSNSFF